VVAISQQEHFDWRLEDPIMPSLIGRMKPCLFGSAVLLIGAGIICAPGALVLGVGWYVYGKVIKPAAADTKPEPAAIVSKSNIENDTGGAV
jgi:hypothetical protein